jgi:hypothetical protein
MDSVVRRIERVLAQRVGGSLRVDVVVFSNARGVIGATSPLVS